MLIAALAFLIVLYAGAVIGLYAAQGSLLYRADSLDLPPETLGLRGVTVERITTEDGIRLVAWDAPGAGARLILFLHGNGGSLVRRAERVDQLARFGRVLAIDYRGFGGSGGTPSEEGLLSDAEAAYRAARARGYAAADIVVLGESLGSGVALKLAARHPVGGVVLAAAYDSIREIAAERFWLFPVRWVLRDAFDVTAELARVSAPVLVLHGTDDSVIPIRHAEALVRGAGANVTFERIEDGPHLILADPEAEQRLSEWLSRLP